MADNKTNIENIRNLGYIAHIDAGKTTTTEGILYRTGLSHKMADATRSFAYFERFIRDS